MATVIKTVCDVCGKEKQLTNHWYMLILAANGDFILQHWDDVDKVRQHLCGQSCATKALSEWMQKGKG